MECTARMAVDVHVKESISACEAWSCKLGFDDKRADAQGPGRFVISVRCSEWCTMLGV